MKYPQGYELTAGDLFRFPGDWLPPPEQNLPEHGAPFSVVCPSRSPGIESGMKSKRLVVPADRILQNSGLRSHRFI